MPRIVANGETVSVSFDDGSPEKPGRKSLTGLAQQVHTTGTPRRSPSLNRGISKDTWQCKAPANVGALTLQKEIKEAFSSPRPGNSVLSLGFWRLNQGPEPFPEPTQNGLMTIRRYAIVGLAALSLALLPYAPALAQKTIHPAVSAQSSWVENFGEQVRTLLETGDAERQEKTMQLVLDYAGRSNVEIDFEPAVPALFDIYEHAETEGLRLLALASLDAIGDEPEFERLAERVRFEQSERVREQTLRVLTARRQQSRSPTHP